MQRGEVLRRAARCVWRSRALFSNMFSSNRIPMQRGDVLLFRFGALVLYFPICGALLWGPQLDHAETKSVPMQRGARFVFCRSVPMQRGARFSILGLPCGAPTWTQ